MLKSRNRRLMGWSLAGTAAAGGALLAVYAASAAQASMGTMPGAVTLNPASGATSGRPSWSTSTACPAGFRGSAVFREVHADGTTTNSISQATNTVAASFSGTLQAPISLIKSLGGIPNGGTQELVVICFSGPSLTGTSHPEMSTFITYSANGASYTSSGQASTSASNPSSPSPSGSGPGSRSSSSGPAPTAQSGSPVSPGPASPAPSPSPVNSDFAVTG